MPKKTTQRPVRAAGSPPGPREPRQPLLVAGIGASAGGLTALKAFFAAEPPREGVAYVIVQHLDPEHTSLTAELLARSTPMSVTQVNAPTRLEGGHVYVIPPNKYLSVGDGALKLSEPTERRGARAPIDFFMRSLAAVHRECAVGVVLTGTGSDGTLGLKAIKGEGGLTIAQQPETAQFDGMPRSAIAAGVVDQVLPVDEIARALGRYAVHPRLAPKSPLPEDESPPDLDAVLALLRTRTKFDFRAYTPKTLQRRTLRRMGLRHVQSIGDYLRFLRDHPDEVEELVHDMLISVTDFFREPDAWKVLEETVIAPLVAAKDPDSTIRAWVPACATGEEPYSLCMIFIEQLQRQNKPCQLQVFATDVDKRALKMARTGVYPTSIAEDLAPERLKRFFTEIRGDHHYRVAKPVREAVVFAEQNVLADPPFSKVDLICCRNLLIYLRPEAQERVRSLFHFALVPGGHLMLGAAETVGKQTDLFEPVSRKWRIFRRGGTTRGERVELPLAVNHRDVDLGVQAPVPRRTDRLANLAQKSLLQEYAPVAALIDGRFDVLYFSGDTDPYLTQPPGPPTRNLLERLRPGLRAKLRGAVVQALRTDEVLGVEARVKRGDRFHPVHLSVTPIHDRQAGERVVLIAFQEARGAPESRRPKKPEKPDESLLGQLETELAETREELQNTVEQLATANEEFQASHEEVMSINEELQSSSEELETAKEELQSLNEELTTVNSELVNKVQELETKNNDLNNLLTSTDIATICLDRELRIRWFTPATRGLMNLTPADIGRPLTDLSHPFLEDDLPSTAERVLETLAPREREVSARGDRSYLRRVLPYRTEDDRIAGVVVTLVDITDRKIAGRQLEAVNVELEQQATGRIGIARLLEDVTQAAGSALTTEEGLREALIRLCEAENWAFGQAWAVSAAGDPELVASWSKTGVPSLDALPELSRRAPPVKGSGLVGRALDGKEPVWIGDVRQSDDARFSGTKLPVRTAAALPVCVDGRVVAALELLSIEILPRHAAFMDILPAVGVQLAHMFKQKFLEREVAAQSDEERRRVARELHDSVGQQLTALSLLAGNLEKQLAADGSPRAGAVHALSQAVDEAKRQVRALTRGLSPVEIDPEGLAAALEVMVEEVRRAYHVQCELDCPRPVHVADSFVAYHLYRIAQEALLNAVKHSGAERIVVSLEDGGKVQLRVRDDGKGPPKEASSEGSGLRIMRYRAGLVGASLAIEAEPHGGTVVSVSMKRPGG